jgi:hypothetical protein
MPRGSADSPFRRLRQRDDAEVRFRRSDGNGQFENQKLHHDA